MKPYVIPQIDWSVVMPIIAVLVTGVLALLVEMFRPKQNNNLIVGVSLAGLIGAFALLLGQVGLEPVSTFSGMAQRDQFAVICQLVMVGATALSFLFSESYLRNKKIAFGEFYPLALWATAGGMIMVGTQNLLMLFVGLEVLSISLYCLAGMSRDEKKSEEAALKYFLLGAFASAVMLFGIAFIFGGSGSLDMQGITIGANSGDEALKTLTVIGLTMILIGLGFKAALVPFHQWTPDVYQGAPTNVTAYMSAVSKIAAFGCLARLLTFSVDLTTIWMPLLTILAILTMTLGNLFALVQKDVKRALAYSSIAHAGYILVGILAYMVSPNEFNLGPVVYYFVSYSLMTVGAFAVITLTSRDGEDGSRLTDLNGLWHRAPFAAVALLVFMVSLIGIPPTAGFFGKYQIFQAALGANLPVLAFALAINSIISTFYYWQIIRAAFVEDETVWTRKLSPMGFGLASACAICMFGLFALVFTPSLIPVLNVAGTDNPVILAEDETISHTTHEDIPLQMSGMSAQ